MAGNFSFKIGFMQGRLSPLVDGRIQAFPADHWREEFVAADQVGLHIMEWTLDHHNLSTNPLMTSMGRQEIQQLTASHGMAIPSLTGDCFMQAPFWKKTGAARTALLKDFDAVAKSASEASIGILVVPLVDNGSIEAAGQAEALAAELNARADTLRSLKIRVAFESDFRPAELRSLVEQFPADVFGINYDTGNSASMGYDPMREWSTYGQRVFNVHIKDRVRGGTTVPLGEGSCDFSECFAAMRSRGYTGNLILQTARATDGNHAEAIKKNLLFLQRFMMPSCN